MTQDWICRFCLCFVLFFLSNPIMAQNKYKGILVHKDPTYVMAMIPLPLKKTWDLSREVLNSYTLETADFESKEIRTQWVRDPYNTKLFSVPGYFPLYEDVRSRLTLRFIEQKIETNVLVHKSFEYYPSLFEGWRPLDSDSIEEYTLLYIIRLRAYIFDGSTLEKKEASVVTQ